MNLKSLALLPAFLITATLQAQTDQIHESNEFITPTVIKGEPKDTALTPSTTTEGKTITIPNLKKPITLPESWTIATRDMLEADLKKKQFESEDEKAKHYSILDLHGKSLFVALALPEPTTEWNAGVSALWIEMPPSLAQLPLAQKKEILMASTQSALAEQLKNPNSKLLQTPTFIGKDLVISSEILLQETYTDGRVGNYVSKMLFSLEGSKFIMLSSTYEEREADQYKAVLEQILSSIPL